mmetsp:Transcript_7833/g.24446  ORF Transcript_7833/g.24446 Transcript_7833/m.24446 type:complete len:413 (+) Transcript_7833:219-1457(+)
MTIVFESLPMASLAPNASRYDLRSATAPMGSRQAIWMVWALLCLVAAIATGAVVLGIARSAKARAISFNIYLAALLVPDFLSLSAFAVSCIVNAAAGEYISPALCGVQAFHLTVSFVSMYWLVALVTLEVYWLLRATRELRDYHPPPPLRAAAKCIAVYSWTVLLASLVFWDGVPIGAVLMKGLVCLPAEYSPASATFTQSVFQTICYLLPLFFTLGVVARIQCLGLLKEPDSRLSRSTRSSLRNSQTASQHGSEGSSVSGARLAIARHSSIFSLASKVESSLHAYRHARSISMYFARLMLSVLWWVPFVVLTSVQTKSSVPIAIGFLLMPIGSIFASTMSLAKRDVREGVMDLLPWRCRSMGSAAVAPQGSETVEPPFTHTRDAGEQAAPGSVRPALTSPTDEGNPTFATR